MSSRLTAGVGGAISLVAAILFAPAATVSAAAPLPTPCQSNINPTDDTGQSLPAQNLPGGLNTRGAVLVNLSAPCSLNYVTAYGKLGGPGPVTKVNLAIRADQTLRMRPR